MDPACNSTFGVVTKFGHPKCAIPPGQTANLAQQSSAQFDVHLAAASQNLWPVFGK